VVGEDRELEHFEARWFLCCGQMLGCRGEEKSAAVSGVAERREIRKETLNDRAAVMRRGVVGLCV